MLSDSLKALRDPGCTLCPLHLKAKSVCVPGQGKALLPVMILGEAPGRKEDTLGIPFVGRSGTLLRTSLQRVGLPLSKCYLTNSVKCYPEGTPTNEERNVCVSNFLRKELLRLRPKLILALGSVALGAITAQTKIGEARGELLLGHNAIIFPTWHPAYILRKPGNLAEWEADLERFVQLVKVELGFGTKSLSEG